MSAGDKPTGLKIIKGSEIDFATTFGDGTNAYVLEFWATWCGPCRQTIPHLSELAHKYKEKNITFVGITDEDEQVDFF